MVVVVIGVSGSGKTAIGEALAARLGWTFEDADNWHPESNVAKMRQGHALTDADRAPWLAALNGAIKNWLSEKRNVVLACSALRESYRQELRDGIQDLNAVRFVYLKGTFAEIDRRLRLRRGHFMPESLLKSQFDALEEPSPSEALIVNVLPPVAEIVNTIVAALPASGA